MITWSGTRTLIAGVGLILLTNAVVLSGAAYNRATPESMLKLSQRELGLPYNWGFAKENSGLALNLSWRVQSYRESGSLMPYFPGGGSPEWLDRSKLAELGFNVARMENTSQGARHINKQLAREVLLILELNGAAYKAALQRARQHAKEAMAAQQANPSDQATAQRAKNAQESLHREEQENSRLFVIDAGLTVDALRDKYPDRNQYAIVRGMVLPSLVEEEGKPRLLGHVSQLSIYQITVPLEFRPVFETALEIERRPYNKTSTPFEVSVTFGKRLEPWITAAQRK